MHFKSKLLEIKKIVFILNKSIMITLFSSEFFFQGWFFLIISKEGLKA